MTQWAPYLSLAVSVCVLAVSIWTTVRAGSWRNSEELREVHKAHAELKGRVQVLETKLPSEIARLDGLVDRLEVAIRRVEDLLVRPPG